MFCRVGIQWELDASMVHDQLYQGQASDNFKRYEDFKLEAWRHECTSMKVDQWEDLVDVEKWD